MLLPNWRMRLTFRVRLGAWCPALGVGVARTRRQARERVGLGLEGGRALQVRVVPAAPAAGAAAAAVACMRGVRVMRLHLRVRAGRVHLIVPAQRVPPPLQIGRAHV